MAKRAHRNAASKIQIILASVTRHPTALAADKGYFGSTICLHHSRVCCVIFCVFHCGTDM